MRLLYSALAFSLLHSVGYVLSTSWETGLDGDLYGEIPRPTSEPLVYRDEFRRRAVLMETNRAYGSNSTIRRNLGLEERQLECNPGYVLTCPLTKDLPCCPSAHPVCCTNPSSNTCCSTGSFCVGLSTCCYSNQIGCPIEEGCCPAGATCCGKWCCGIGTECRDGDCIDLAMSSVSVASVSAERSRSIASVAAESSRSSASAAATEYANSSGGTNVALVGGAVGGALGGLVLILVAVLLWRRKRPAPPSASHQPYLGAPTSSQPITPASQTFSSNSNYHGGPPVMNAPQPGWNPQQLSPVTQQGGPGSPRLSHPAQSPSPPYSVNTWVDRPPTIHNENWGGYPSQPNINSFVSH